MALLHSGNEVLWIRYLSLLVRNTVYTYSLTLTVVLVGIVLGSLLTAAVARRGEAPIVAFGATQILTGICVSILMLLPPRAWGMLGQADLWVYLWLLLPPAALAGAAFPLAIRVAVEDPSLVGGSIRQHGRGEYVGRNRRCLGDGIHGTACGRHPDQPLAHHGPQCGRRNRRLVALPTARQLAATCNCRGDLPSQLGWQFTCSAPPAFHKIFWRSLASWSTFAKGAAPMSP